MKNRVVQYLVIEVTCREAIGQELQLLRPVNSFRIQSVRQLGKVQIGGGTAQPRGK